MENGSGSADGSLQHVCEDETVVDERVKVRLRAYKTECSDVIWVLDVNCWHSLQVIF